MTQPRPDYWRVSFATRQCIGGDSDNHFHSLLAFLAGYGLGRRDGLDQEAQEQLDNIIPPKFHEFVTEYYGQKFPLGGYGWTTFIEENTDSGEDALSLFLKLRHLYDEHQTGQPGTNED